MFKPSEIQSRIDELELEVEIIRDQIKQLKKAYTLAVKLTEALGVEDEVAVVSEVEESSIHIG